MLVPPLHSIGLPSPCIVGTGLPPLHFKEDELRVKQSRFRLVILSAAKDDTAR
jgi:hypothetical protein